MAVSVGANGALSTRIKSTSERVSVGIVLSPNLTPSVISVNDSVSDNTISAAPAAVSVRDRTSDS